MFRRSFVERCMLLCIVHITIVGGDCINYSFFNKHNTDTHNTLCMYRYHMSFNNFSLGAWVFFDIYSLRSLDINICLYGTQFPSLFVTVTYKVFGEVNILLFIFNCFLAKVHLGPLANWWWWLTSHSGMH